MQKKTQSCLKISGGIVLFLICIAGALVGGYYLRTLRMETTNPNNGFPYGPVTWKEAVCQKEMNHTATNSECRSFPLKTYSWIPMTYITHGSSTTSFSAENTVELDRLLHSVVPSGQLTNQASWFDIYCAKKSKHVFSTWFDSLFFSIIRNKK